MKILLTICILLMGVGCVEKEPELYAPYATRLEVRELEKQIEMVKEYLEVDTYCNGWAYEPYKSPRGVDCELKTTNDTIKKEWGELWCDDYDSDTYGCVAGEECTKKINTWERCKELKQLLNK